MHLTSKVIKGQREICQDSVHFTQLWVSFAYSNEQFFRNKDKKSQPENCKKFKFAGALGLKRYSYIESLKMSLRGFGAAVQLRRGLHNTRILSPVRTGGCQGDTTAGEEQSCKTPASPCCTTPVRGKNCSLK